MAVPRLHVSQADDMLQETYRYHRVMTRQVSLPP